MTATLTTLTAAAKTALPGQGARIDRAAAIVSAQDVYPLTSGSWLVGSQSDAQSAHLVKRGPWACTCADHIHRHTTCKHIISAMLVVKLGTTYHATYTMPEAA